MRGFVSAMIGANGVAHRRRGSRPASGSVSQSSSPAGVARGLDARGHRQRHDRGPDQRRQPDVRGTRPGRELRQDVGAADQYLQAKSARAAVERRTSSGDRGRIVRARTMHHTNRATMTIASTPVGEHRDRARSREIGNDAVAHQRPLAEGEPRALGADVGADEQQPVGRSRRPGDQPSIAAAAPTPPGATCARGDRHRDPRDEERDREVDRHDARVLVGRDDPAADRGLRHEQGEQDHGQIAAGRSRSRRRSSDHAAGDPQCQGQAPARGTRAAGACTRSECGTRSAGSRSRNTAASPGTRRPSRLHAPPRPTRSAAGWRRRSPWRGRERCASWASAHHDRRSACRWAGLGILGRMTPTSAAAVPALAGVATRIDEVLGSFLEDRRAEAVAIEPRATEPIDEIERLVRAGGKRHPAGVLRLGVPRRRRRRHALDLVGRPRRWSCCTRWR